MANIGFLGLGAMGARMASRLVAAGHKVTVWNRNQQATASFVASNVSTAGTPAQAALGADFVFSMLRDNKASEFVWLDERVGAINGLAKSAIAIECSTLTPEHIDNLGKALGTKNVTLVDAPVVGSRPQAEAGKLVFLVGAQHNDYPELETVLNPMAGAVHYMGEAGSGSKVKLAVNALFALQLAGIAELLGFLKASGVSLATAMAAIASLPIASPALALSSQAMLARQFTPAFPIELVAKDLSYLASSSSRVKVDTPASEVVGKLFEQANFNGFGDENITAISRLFL